MNYIQSKFCTNFRTEFVSSLKIKLLYESVLFEIRFQLSLATKIPIRATPRMTKFVLVNVVAPLHR